MNYKIAICDDNISQAEYLSTYVHAWLSKTGNLAIIKIFPSAEAFLFEYAEDKDYDILLLDIEMGKINGIELARRIRHDNETIQIVFTTGYYDFISEGYEVSALQYLMKPVSYEKLESVLNKAVKNLERPRRAIIFDIAGESLRVYEDEIVYAEATAHSCIIQTKSQRFEVKSGIAHIKKLLGDNFIACHRSYIVNIAYVKSIAKIDICLDNGLKIPLSRRRYDEVNRLFITYYKGITNG